MPANAMVAPPGVDGRIFYDESVRGFNFHRERVPLAVALNTLLKYQHDDSPPTIYIDSTTIDTYLPGLRAENALDTRARAPLASVWTGHPSRISAHPALLDDLPRLAPGPRPATLFPPAPPANPAHPPP